MSISKGKNQQDVKKQNRSLILKLICTGKNTSRAEIARKTGLTKMTVTNIINTLIAEGFVYEGIAEEKTSVGRKAIYLHPTKNNYFSIGIYLSRDFIVFSLLSLDARIVKIHSVSLKENETIESLNNKFLDGIRVITENTPKEKILGVGVASIGPVDIKNGILLNPTDFYNIQNMNLKSFIEEQTGFLVTVNNDMNAAALAELLYAKRTKINNFIYVGITHGIGSGIVINGALYTGESGFSGEIGHTTIHFSGETCSCGNRGCLEVYASIPNVIKKVKEQTKKELSFAEILKSAKQEESPYKEIIDEVCYCIGTALANAINTLDSKQIILGHDAAQGEEYFAKKIEDVLNSKILFKNSKFVKVEISSFKEQTPIIGSGVLVINELLFKIFAYGF